MTHSVCIGEEIDTADGKMQRTTRSASLLAASTVTARYLLQPWPVGPFSLPQAGTRLCARSLGRPGIQPTSPCVSDRPRRPARPAGLCTPLQTATAACKLPFPKPPRPPPDSPLFFGWKVSGQMGIKVGTRRVSACNWTCPWLPTCCPPGAVQRSGMSTNARLIHVRSSGAQLPSLTHRAMDEWPAGRYHGWAPCTLSSPRVPHLSPFFSSFP
jgi:hypothetical protein